MARNGKIEYIRFYTQDNLARNLEPEEPRRPRRPRPQPREKRIPIPFDPVAVFGISVALVMILCVIVGFFQMNGLNDQISDMERQISTLKSQQYALQKQYNAEIDLEEIRQTAEAMGMVPVDSVRHVTITIPQPVEEPELSWWQELWLEFKAMFE